MKEKIIGIIYIVLGIGIIGLWTMLIGTDQVPEFETEPVGIAFHIAIEVMMGIMAILSGIALLRKYKHRASLTIFTGGMLAYSVVNSSGYYGDSGQYAMISIFSVVLLVVIISTVLLTKNKQV
ncbi:MAG: hypothetical protein JXB20_05210 [Bacilli bacterium]|nr:hypothetical protein [Bacilli bacterium]MBN2696218.1 hypothetical protein [Bacilli bacterium]